jgi:hypothetical protein
MTKLHKINDLIPPASEPDKLRKGGKGVVYQKLL